MRATKLTAVALLVPTFWVTSLPAWANGKRIVEPSCEVIPPNCAAPEQGPRLEPNCEAPKKPCPPPCETPPQAPPQQTLVPQPLGAFVQPPATGEVRGPAYSTEVQGAIITFPELRLRMPSIRMPSVAKYRSDARMEMAPAHAPYVAAPVAAAPYAAPKMAAPYAAPYAAMPYAPPAAPYAPPAAPTQPPAAPMQPPAAPPYRAPDCAATNNHSMAAFDPLEEKLRRIEAAERRLQAQVDELHRCLKQLPANQQQAVVEPVKAGRIPLRPIGPIGNSGNVDGSQPAAPPNPPPDLGRQPRMVPMPSLAPYPAQPAAHYQPALQPRQVIREPGQPRGVISGVR